MTPWFAFLLHACFAQASVVEEPVTLGRVYLHEQPELFVKKIRAIRDGNLEGRQFFKNVRVEGRILPSNQKFLILEKDGKRRFEMGAFVENTGQHQVYRLDDGEQFYMLNHHALGIATLDGRDQKWRDATAVYAKYVCVNLDEGNQAIDGFCDWLIEMERKIREKEVDAPSGSFFVFENEGLVHCRYETGEDVASVGGRYFEAVFDSHRNYNVVHWEELYNSIVGAENTYRYRIVVDAESQELASGIYFLKKGTCLIEIAGTNAEKKGNVGASKEEIVIDQVDFGDIQVADSEFSFNSLPVQEGFAVHDERITPAADYVYGKSPLDETKLHQMHIKSEPLKKISTPLSARLWIVYLNIFLVAVFGFFLIFRRRAKKS